MQPTKKKGVYVERKLGGVLMLVHTPYGIQFFDKVAKLRIARVYARFNTYLMPAISLAAIFLIVASLAAVSISPSVRQESRAVGIRANLLIPIVNPYVPVVEGVIALFVTILIHEAGHGIVARVYGMRVDSTGIVLILGIPIGAFVNIERDELAKGSLAQKSAVLTAGPLNNMILAGVSLVALFFVVSTLTPIEDSNAPHTGVSITRVTSGALADSLGITPDSVILSVNGQQLHQVQDLSSLLRSNLGKQVQLQWVDSSGHQFSRSTQLPADVPADQPILGVEVAPIVDAKAVLDNYKSYFTNVSPALILPPTLGQGQVVDPFSPLMAPKYTSSIGPLFSPLANGLFWLWFVNFNVGIFNALPIGPLDGGQLYGSIIEKRARSPIIANKANSVISLVTVGIVMAALFLPYMLA